MGKGTRNPLTDLNTRLKLAEQHHNKAFALNHNDPRVVAQKGELLTWQGQPDEGAVWIRLAMRLDPSAAASRTHLLVRALHIGRHYEEAIDTFSQIEKHRYNHYVEISACYAQLGLNELAKQYASEVILHKPDFTVKQYINSLPFLKNEDPNTILLA